MPDTFTAMGLALCASLHVQCETAGKLFYDSVLSKNPALQYEEAIACDNRQSADEGCDLDVDYDCVAISTYSYPVSGPGVIYFCRPKPYDNGGEG